MQFLMQPQHGLPIPDLVGCTAVDRADRSRCGGVRVGRPLVPVGRAPPPKYHPLPWKMLSYDTRLGGYVVDLDRTKLEYAPSYTSTDAPDWSDRSYTARIDEYWLLIY
jgi:hypothetical protein